MKKLRILMVTLCVAVLLCGFSVTAYAGGGHLGYPNYTMGDSYQLISIAAVVIGGTSILGGHGGYLGTMGGVVIIYLIQSILIILNIAEAGREIVNGAIILIILLAYGRGKKQSA